MLPIWLVPHQQLLSSQILSRHLPHALLISGIEGAGKRALTRWLMQSLLCQHLKTDDDAIVQPCGQCKHCDLYLAGNFPDHIEIRSEKNNIGVDEIRRTNQFLQKTAQLSGYKTVAIPAAQTMTESAANALLKTLEEPSEHSLLVLISPDQDRLLPTIISRCRLIAIRPPVGDNLTLENNVAADVYRNLTHRNELTSPELFTTYQLFVDAFSDFLLGKGERRSLLQTLTDNEQAIRWLEKVFTDIIRHIHQWPSSVNDDVKKGVVDGQLTQKNIETCYKIFLRSHQQLVNLVQVNKNFVLEKMLITMQRAINHR